jgi:hypothetical protein
MPTPRTFCVIRPNTAHCCGTLLPGCARLPVTRRKVYQSANLDWLMETASLRQGSLLLCHCAGSHVFSWRICRIAWALEPRANNCDSYSKVPVLHLDRNTGYPDTICVAFLSPFRNFRNSISGSVITASFHIVYSLLSTDVTQSTRARRVIVMSGRSVLLRWINREGENQLILAGYVTSYQA